MAPKPRRHWIKALLYLWVAVVVTLGLLSLLIRYLLNWWAS